MYAVRLLGGLATDEQVRPRIGEPECIGRMSKMLFNYAPNNAENTLAILMAMRNIAANTRNAQELHDQPGLVRKLVDLLDMRKYDYSINENAAGIILNISGTGSCTL
jgi:hypothetical protein